MKTRACLCSLTHVVLLLCWELTGEGCTSVETFYPSFLPFLYLFTSYCISVSLWENSCCLAFCLTLAPWRLKLGQPSHSAFSPTTTFPGLLQGVGLSNSICPLRGSEKLQTDIFQLTICSFEHFLLIRCFQRQRLTLSVKASGGMGSCWLFVLRLSHSLSWQL